MKESPARLAPCSTPSLETCEVAGEPDLTALVVHKRTRLPGAFLGQPVTAGTTREARWHHELARIRSHAWSNPGSA